MPVLLLTALLVAPPGVVTAKDIPYWTVAGETLRLDLAVPSGPGPHPLVVGFHGGAWKLGSRKELSDRPRWEQDYGTENRPFTEFLARHGYAAASVSYRFMPKHKFPAQIEDAKAAVRFLRANAKAYNLDPGRIAAAGFSAGGHLAALIGTAGPDAGFDVGPFPEVSSRVRCVIDYFGPADLRLYTEASGIEGAFMVPFLGARYAAKPELYRRASPVEYVSKDDPPFQIVHGTADFIVPILHSERLRDKLTAAGVPVEYRSVPGKGHGWTGEAAADTTKQMLAYLDRYLKGAK